MKKWQRGWLYLLIGYSTLHLVRDIFQDVGISNFLTDILSSNSYKISSPFTNLSTYIIALTEIALALYLLRKNDFGRLGFLTMFIAFVTTLVWFFNYFP